MADAKPFERFDLAADGVALLNIRDYDIRTEAGAREALARVSVCGTERQKNAVRAAVAHFYPNIGKAGGKSLRDLYANSNMKD